MTSGFSWFAAVETLGIISFAVNAMIVARDKGLSSLGVFACTVVAAFGGGTLRDVLLGPQAQPFFWVANPFYIVAILLLATLYCNTRVMQWIIAHRDRYVKETAEALAAASLCATGSVKTFSIIAPGSGTGLLDLAHLWVLCAFMGMIASGFGTVIRDVLINEFPRVLLPRVGVLESAFAGSAAVVTLLMLTVPKPWAILAGFLSALAVRGLYQVAGKAAAVRIKSDETV
jgi:uncharacterized membrane protein YeiH